MKEPKRIRRLLWENYINIEAKRKLLKLEKNLPAVHHCSLTIIYDSGDGRDGALDLNFKFCKDYLPLSWENKNFGNK